MAVPLRVKAARDREPPRWPAILFDWLLLVSIVWGTMTFGAVYPWGYWPLAVACAALGFWAIVTEDGWRLQQPGTLFLSLGLVAVAMVVQIVPLPYALFVRLAPAADRFLREYQFGYSLNVPAWHAASLVPEETFRVLLLFCALALFLAGLVRAPRRLWSIEWLVPRLIAFGVGLAIFGAVQKSFAYEGHKVLVYGFWEPSRRGSPFGPFINHNHFAGWMLLAMPLAIGYACARLEMARRPRGRDWGRWLRWMTTPDASGFQLVAFCILAMGTSVVLTGSRSGLAGLAVALCVLAAFIAARIGGTMGRTLGIGLLVCVLAGAVAWAGVGHTLGRFSLSLLATDVPGRWSAWRDTLRIIRDFPVFGIGMGNYGLAMLIYQTGAHSQFDAIFFQAHNDYLQVLAEGGLLVCIPAGVVLVTMARTIRARLTEPDTGILTYWIRAGAVASLAGMAAQSFVEFSLQIPGITALFVVVLAIALHPPREHAHRI